MQFHRHTLVINVLQSELRETEVKVAATNSTL
jgi:hypothetical protein